MGGRHPFLTLGLGDLNLISHVQATADVSQPLGNNIDLETSNRICLLNDPAFGSECLCSRVGDVNKVADELEWAN